MKVPRLNNNDEDGDELAREWRELKEEEPDDASLVRKAVDKGKERSIDYYVGFNQALIKISSMYPGLPLDDSQKGIIYRLMLAYTEYQIRNT